VLDGPADVLKQPIDAVLVEGRLHENLKWACTALEAGFPVRLEKPAGHDLEWKSCASTAEAYSSRWQGT
jgi:predicted dehydrogenase